MNVTILCGISGSGKSTWAKHMRPGVIVVSADHYFMVDGVYRFDPSKIGDAHGQCIRNFCESIRQGFNVVVDNTNTSREELAVYMGIANAYGATVELVWFRCDPNEAIRRNAHNVPASTILKMNVDLNRTMTTLPPWWPKPTEVTSS